MFNNHRLIIVILFVIAIAGSYSPPGTWIESSAYDLYARMLPENERSSEVVVVALDSKAIKETGDWPWPDRTLGKLINNLHAAKPKTIGILLPLDQSPGRQKGKQIDAGLKKFKSKKQRRQVRSLIKRLDDRAYLLSALSRHGRVILSVPYRNERESVSRDISQSGIISPVKTAESVHVYATPWLKPLFAMPGHYYSVTSVPAKRFVDSATGIGLASANQAGRMVQRTSLLPDINGVYYPSFTLQLVSRALGVKTDSVTAVPGETAVIGETVVNLDPGNFIYPVATSKDQGGVPVFSALDVLNAAVDHKLLKGKTVLIGLTAPGYAPEFYGAGGSKYSPVIWQAHSTNSVLNNSVTQVPGWSSGLQRIAVFLAAVYLFLLPARLRGRVGLIISIVLALLLLNVGFIVMLTKAVWLMLALPALFLLVGHVVMAFHFQQSSRLLRVYDEKHEAWRKLGGMQQSQGKLDDAFTSFEQCPVDEDMAERLYKLALDYERRRQFSQASAVYDRISGFDTGFRDINERRERHNTLPNKKAVFTGTSSGMTSTIVIDDPKVERPVLGRYKLEGELGRGAMGMVYLGKDPTIGRTVAVKTLALSEEFEDDYIEEVRRRFFIEAETAGRLNHPNIVTIFDAGEEHDLAYIAMDYIKGEPLNNFSRKGNLLSVDKVFSIGIRAAIALDYAHRQKVVHRDVKPGNMIYDPDTDTLKITDFGIACLTDNSKTRSGTVLGSPSYMSPEQLSGVKVDGRSDLFSLGVTLYQLFTGELPYQAESMAALAYQIMNDKHKSIRKLRPELPGCLTRIVNKAMEKDVKLRYPDGNAMAEALKRCAG